MKPTQESKYDAVNGRLVNRASGEAIPDDEPVFVFRARDADRKGNERHEWTDQNGTKWNADGDGVCYFDETVNDGFCDAAVDDEVREEILRLAAELAAVKAERDLRRDDVTLREPPGQAPPVGIESLDLGRRVQGGQVSRDPKHDPQPGDVLRTGGVSYRVKVRTRSRVTWRGATDAGSTLKYKGSVSAFREFFQFSAVESRGPEVPVWCSDGDTIVEVTE